MRRLKTLLVTAALLAPLALVPMVDAQVSITIGGPPPVCPYGYYGYAPYSCAPVGYYGPGYFYNGIFLGVGPWAYWGYHHGWGGHRFVGAGGGRYRYGPAYRGRAGGPAYRGRAGGPAYRGREGARPAYRGRAGGPAARGGTPHGAVRGGAPHAAARGGAEHKDEHK